MPIIVDFKLPCSDADRARVRAAKALLEGLAEGDEATMLPAELLGAFESIEDFMNVFCDNDIWSLGGYFYEAGDAIVIQEDDAELDRIVDLISSCCRDALPVAFSWSAYDGPGGSVAIFKDNEYWLAAGEAEQLLLDKGRREAAGLAAA